MICVLYVIFIIDKEQGCADGKCYLRPENKCITDLRQNCDNCQEEETCVYGKHCGDISQCVPKSSLPPIG